MITEEKPQTGQPDGAPKTGARWGQDRRLEFIEYRLRWGGRLNRSDLTAFFGISIPQASLDLTEYARRAPANLEYDKSTRTYLAGAGFQPIFPASDLDHYLDDLKRSSSATDKPVDSFLGWHPPVALTPKPSRHLDPYMVATIVRAIREGSALRVQYQSLSRSVAYPRTLTPHALAQDGWRWHIRAYCHSRQDFRDFVIARILKVEGVEGDRPRGDEDSAWHHILRVVLAPHPKLSEAHQRAIELDYGMTEGVCEFECRQALLFYVLRQLGLDRESNRSPEDQQVVLNNRDELSAFLPITEFR